MVFRLDLPASRTVTATTEGSTFDTVITLRQGACTDGSEILCDDSSGPNDTSYLQTVLDPGTYYFVVDGFGSQSGSYDFEIKVTP